MMRILLVVATLALATAACREAGETVITAPPGPKPAPAITPALSVGCMTPFLATATRAELAAAFGPENVVQQTVDAPEGERLAVTVLYPNDPEKRAEIVFADDAAGTGLSGVMVSGADSEWSGPSGMKAGDPVDAVERANGGVFMIAGFNWDYGGYVTDWKGGQLQEAVPGCRTVVRFTSGQDGETAKVMGEKSHQSDSAGMRAAMPKVVRFGITWSTPPQ
ncbi:MAG: hypothetical protein Q8R02_01390 [Hyphomonadaceae bacterium]|nr:hypothetical protein [Hyphomonadaceae bacterium]